MTETQRAPQRRRISATELLDRGEKDWSPKLRGASLVAEVEVSDKLTGHAARALGVEYRRRVTEGKRLDIMFSRWPACVAVAMAGVATHGYEHGAYWPALWEWTGYEPRQNDREVWGGGFREAVGALGMPVFADQSLKNVGPIVMHAGIPTYCLDDFFRLLLKRQEHDPGLDAEAFLSWATAPGKESRLNSLDTPARSFIKHGSDYAADVVERSIELLDRLRRRSTDTDGLGLPARFVQRATELAENGLFDAAARIPESAPKRPERPRLQLDPYGRGVYVWLPPVGDAPDGTARWHVTVDGVLHVERSQAMWVDAAEGVPPTTHILGQPARSVQAAVAGSPDEHHLQVVDPANPLLLFTPDGKRLPSTLALPPANVWALYPQERGLTWSGTVRVVSEGILPVGWGGWELTQLDLTNATELGLEDSGRMRPVRGHTRPQLELGDALPGVTTPYGSPVFAEPPTLWLPGEANAETTWKIEVWSRAERRTIISRTITTHDAKTVDDLWEPLSRPLLGAFDVSVRGPLARGIHRSLFIAEGLAVNYQPAVRTLNRAGLSRARAELSAPPGASLQQQRLSFGEHERNHPIGIEVPGLSEPLIVTPPHMEVLRERTGETATWHTGPLRMTTESFDIPGDLLVRVPDADSVPALRVRSRGRSIQELEPSGQVHRGLVRFDLRRVADTIVEQRYAEFLLPLEGGACPLARVQPQRLFSEIHHRGEYLELTDSADVPGMTAAIYTVAAPWREPVRITVADGHIPLPAELRHCGPLRVLIWIDDPWIPTELARWPERGDSARCDAPGWFDAGDDDETALSRFLVGESEFPARASELGRLWLLVDLSSELNLPVTAEEITAQCAWSLRANPAHALRALLDSELPPERSLIALVASGLATSMPDEDISGASLRRMWSTIPAVAAMVGDTNSEAWQDYAEMECGAAAPELLHDRDDPHASVGRFGPETAALDEMPLEQLDYVWREAAVVPRELLDQDSRLTAARQLFDQRRGSAAKRVALAARPLLREATEVIESSHHAHLQRQIEQRHQPQRHNWSTLPAVSAALAAVARLAARHHGAATACEQRFRREWTALASIAPKLVMIDLVLAELLITGRERTSHD